MATLDTRQPRKKFATYGKTARKRILNFESESPGEQPTSKEIWDIPDDGAGPEPEVHKSPQMRSPASKTGRIQHGVQTKPASTLSRKTSKKHMDRSTADPDLGDAHHPRDKATDGRGAALGKGSEELEVFDIPSSDDEPPTLATKASAARTRPPNALLGQHRSPKRTSDSDTPESSPSNELLKDGSATPTKRQRMALGLSNTTRPAVYDDDALQRHIAMEVGDAYDEDCVPAKDKGAEGRKERDSKQLAMRSRKQKPSQNGTQRSLHTGLTSSKVHESTLGSSDSTSSPRKQRQSNTTFKPPAKATSKILMPSPVFQSAAEKDDDDLKLTRESETTRNDSKDGNQRRKNGLNDKSKIDRPSASPHTPSSDEGQSKSARQLVAVEVTPSRLKIDSLQLSPHQQQLHNATSAPSPPLNASHLDGDAGPVAKAKVQNRRRLIDSLVGNSIAQSGGQEAADLEAQAKDLSNSESSSDEDKDDKSDGDGDVVMQSSSKATTTEYASGSQPSSQGAPVAQGGPKITYAQQRSYLSESAVDEMTMLNTPLDVGGGLDGRGGSGAGKRNLRAPVQAVDDDEESGDEKSGGPMKSIHELRQAGGNKRFLDESEAIFEDIEDKKASSISRRRMGLLNVGKRLVEKEYAQQFVDRDLDRRLFHQLDAEQDVIVCFAFASIIALLIHHGLGNLSLSHIRQEGAMVLLTRLLDFDKSIVSIAKDRRTNMSKVAQATVSEYASSAGPILLPLVQEPTRIAPSTVSLLCLKLMTRSSREVGEAGEVLSLTAIQTLVSRLDQAETWAANEHPSLEDTAQLELTLAILEAYTLHAGSLSDSSVQAYFGSSSVIKLLPLVSQWQSEVTQPLQLSTLRLLLNVTNRQPKICRKIATIEVVRSLVEIIRAGFETESDTADDDERMTSVDFLILALATLTNLTEWTDDAQPRIWLGGSEKQGNLLNDLLTPLVRGLQKASEADSMEETQSNVAFGYLAVLFSVLCLQPEIRRYTCSRLPGSTIQPLVAAIEEFLQYHQRVDDQLRQEGLGGDAQDGFKERLQANLDLLKSSS